MAEYGRGVQAEQHQAAEGHRQFMEEMRKTREDVRMVAEQLRESAEVVRQLHEARAREHEVRLQHIEQRLHLTISEFQKALVQQWKVTNDATASSRTLLHTAEQLLKAAQEKRMER